MRHSLFASDESLPTWLHTLLLFLVTSPFYGFSFYYGIGAIVSVHLEPLGGPDFGQYFFGNVTLDGTPAKIAGVSLIALGFSFVAIAIQHSRLAIADAVARTYLSWIFLAISIALSFWV
jgi:hypothetical protein